MYLTNEVSIGGKNTDGAPEDLSFIVKYCWQSPKHMKEAVKILLSARLVDSDRQEVEVRFLDADTELEQREAQMRLALNPHSSSYVLDYLSKFAGAKVCEFIANNPRCSDETMQTLSEHRDPEVRAALTENPYCSITILYALAKDEHCDVRYRLAENPNLPESILEELTHDENPFVAAKANETLFKLSTGTVIEGKFPSILPGLKVCDAG